MGMGLISQKVVQSQIIRRPLMAASELGLHYFLCHINATTVVKGLNSNLDSNDCRYESVVVTNLGITRIHCITIALIVITHLGSGHVVSQHVCHWDDCTNAAVVAAAAAAVAVVQDPGPPPSQPRSSACCSTGLRGRRNSATAVAEPCARARATVGSSWMWGSVISVGGTRGRTSPAGPLA